MTLKKDMLDEKYWSALSVTKQGSSESTRQAEAITFLMKLDK